MEDIQKIAESLAADKPLPETRKLIIDAIDSRISEFGEDLGNWEKTYLAGAISAVAANLQLKEQGTDAWLRYALSNLSKALVPKEERNESYTGKENDSEWITHSLLKGAVDELRIYNRVLNDLEMQALAVVV